MKVLALNANTKTLRYGCENSFFLNRKGIKELE